LLTSAAYSSSVALETCVCTGVAVAGVAARAKAASTAAAESQKVFGRCLVVLIIRLVFMAILDWCSLTADRFGSWDGLRREAGGSSIGGHARDVNRGRHCLRWRSDTQNNSRLSMGFLAENHRFFGRMAFKCSSRKPL
jgi:hypothetical protein